MLLAVLAALRVPLRPVPPQALMAMTTVAAGALAPQRPTVRSSSTVRATGPARASLLHQPAAASSQAHWAAIGHQKEIILVGNNEPHFQ